MKTIEQIHAEYLAYYSRDKYPQNPQWFFTGAWDAWQEQERRFDTILRGLAEQRTTLSVPCAIAPLGQIGEDDEAT